MSVTSYIFGRKYGYPDLISGLIHAWKFEETSGTTGFDSIGSSNITHVNGVLVNQTGKVDKCVSYDGTNDYSYALVSTSYPFSYKLWYNTSNASAGRIIVGGADRASNSSSSFYKGIEIAQSANRVVVRFGDGLGGGIANRRDYITDSVCLVNGWNCLFINVISFGVVEIYVDGVLYQNSYSSGTATSVNLTNFYNRIFCNTPSIGVVYSGSIDEFFIYNTTKTATQIQQIYNLENAGISIL